MPIVVCFGSLKLKLYKTWFVPPMKDHPVLVAMTLGRGLFRSSRAGRAALGCLKSFVG